jgi:hypothetical protein
MIWLVVEAGLELLQLLRRLAARGLLLAGQTVVPPRQSLKPEDSPMGNVVSLKTWKLTHHPAHHPAQLQSLQALADQVEAEFLGQRPMSSDLPPDPTNQ